MYWNLLAAWKARCKYYRAIYDIAVDDQIEKMDLVSAAEKRVAELEELLSDRETDLGYEYDRANYMDKRGTELEEALASLLDGLDSNYDERCGLTNKEWEQRISEARTVLNK